MSAVGNYEVVSQTMNVPAGSSVQELTLSAPPGKVVLGGGYTYLPEGNNLKVVGSAPLTDGSGWRVRVWRDSGVNLSVTVYATVAEMGC